MTQNQISYARQQEDARHNVEIEKLQSEANRIAKYQAAIAAQQAQIAAMNAATNQYSAQTQRTQTYADIVLNAQKQSEIKRHNLAGENLSERSQNIQIGGNVLNTIVQFAGTIAKVLA